MITIRPAVLEDARAVAIINANGWKYAYKNILSPEFLEKSTNQDVIDKKIRGFPQRLADSMARNNIILVADDNGKVVGSAGGRVPKSPECKADKELYNLYIDTDCIGAGLGKKLFQSFATEMRKQGAKTFGLMCFSDNESIGFYKHMGGTITCERPSGEKYECKMGSFLEFNIDEVLEK